MKEIESQPPPPPAEVPFRVRSRVLFGFAIFATVVAILVSLAANPRSYIVDRFIELPWATRIAISPAYPAFLALTGVIGLAKEFAIRNAKHTLYVNAVHLALITVLQVLWVFAVSLALRTPIRAIG